MLTTEGLETPLRLSVAFLGLVTVACASATLSPAIKPGYANHVAYTHSSTLRTVQEIFELSPFLGDAANASDLSDLFTTFP